ncbi:MAG: FAD-binding oxidoreductase [Planctomycetes bacterium]|nr:FAD-binding oxidoreductase [Planctomycetota bacterium]
MQAKPAEPLAPTDPELLRQLADLVGPENVSATLPDRLAYSRDLWPFTTIEVQHGHLGPAPDGIVWARSIEDISKILRWARDRRVRIVPFGGGSGVCGGTFASGGGFILDLKRMDRILSLDPVSLTLKAEAGIIGERLERELNARGFTMGHFPSSIYCSTFGGWVATRSAGQLSTKYGKIEDMILGLTAVLPDGRVMETRVAPRTAAGPSLTQLFVGSEGTLGVIADATVRVWPVPEVRLFRGYAFPDVQSGLTAIRRTLHAGVRPAAVRLYDELDTFIIGTGKGAAAMRKDADGHASPGLKKVLLHKAQSLAIAYPRVAGLFEDLLPETCLLILGFEGGKELSEVEESVARRLCVEAGGKDLGPEPGRSWWERRYSVSFSLSPVYEEGNFADTIEMATTWDKIQALYDGVRATVRKHAMIMAHFSHAYPEGVSVYFTFAGASRDRQQAQALYQKVWSGAMEACIAAGGTITHHHGVGVLKAPWMAAEHGLGLELIQALKRQLDPDNLLNPGKLGL